MDDFSSLLRAQMLQVGLTCPADIRVTDDVVRFKTDGDHEANSWYALHQDGDIFYGGFGCWKRSITESFYSRQKKDIPRDQWLAMQKRIAEAKRKADEEKARRHSEAAKTAAGVLSESPPVESHPYLEKKKVRPHGHIVECSLDKFEGWLALPLIDESGKVQNLQLISPEGEKHFQYGGKVKGCFFDLASPEKFKGPILIAEGYATGATCHEATNWPTRCAMNSGNLPEVAMLTRTQYPNAPIIIAGDEDRFQKCLSCKSPVDVKTHDTTCPHCHQPHKQINAGRVKAEEAAKKVGGYVSIPWFPNELFPQRPTDFNDARIHGATDEDIAVRLSNALPVKAISIGDLQLPPPNDPSEIIKNRFLCRGGAVLLTGPTGVGKSSLLMQLLALWALGEPAFELTPTKPINSIIIQAENDDGDLAYMRDGICRGLEFPEARRGLFFHRVKVHTSNGIVGDRFVKDVLEPLLSIHECDLIVIDPVLAYLGGDAKEQEIVSAFLRQHLQPLLIKYNVAAIILHHTNKPKEKKGDAVFGELAYSGSGSAEFANWARAVLALQATTTPGVFALHAGKRGGKLGWRDENDQMTYQKLIRHSRDAQTICWSEASVDDLNDPPAESAKAPSEEAVLGCLPDGGLSPEEWHAEVSERLGRMTKSAFERVVNKLNRAEKVHYSKVFEKWQPDMKIRYPNGQNEQ